MAKVKKTYQRWEAAGDAYCGRLLAGNDVCSPKFALLPPNFPNVTQLVQETVELAYPTLACGDGKLRMMATFLLASLVYHEAWLRANLSEKHPIFETMLFCQPAAQMNQLKSLVECRIAQPEDALKSTGK